MGNPNQSKYDYLLSQNKNYMDLTALSTINGSVSYLQLHENIEKYEKLLISKGVRPGDRIGVCALNTPESVYLLYALDKIGAIVIGFSPLDNAEKIQKDIKLTKPKMVITVDLQYKNFKNSEKALSVVSKLQTLNFPIIDNLLTFLINCEKYKRTHNISVSTIPSIYKDRIKDIDYMSYIERLFRYRQLVLTNDAKTLINLFILEMCKE